MESRLPSTGAGLDGDARVCVADAPLQASLADRMRVWETRKFCQVKPALVRYSRDSRGTPFDSSGSYDTVVRDECDYALTAIARTLVYELDAAVAMITLLDDTTQYFLSGAEKSSLSCAHATLESTRWYGCDTILHAGGLCPRTIGLREGQILEELDMDQRVHTKDLPIVNGTLSKFRHYAGVPLVTKSKINIGTVFIFREGPTQPLNTEHGEFLINTASQVMVHLQQAIRALEAKRMAKFNIAITSLLVYTQDHAERIHDTVTQLSPPARDRRGSSSLRGRLPALADVYGQAADLLLDSFEFAGVFIHEVPLRARASRRPSGPADLDCSDVCLAEAGKINHTSSVCMPDALARKLLQCWPSGEVLYLSADYAGNLQFSSAGRDSSQTSSEQAEIGFELAKYFPDVQQLLFTPLWDSLHSRAAAIAVGWVTDWGRTYTRTSDLSPIYAFCMTVMAQIRRLEARLIEQRQTDFLGSISHEMRSPLHGNLASIELLLKTTCTDEQRRLMLDALNSGRQLLDTIDKILEFSQISDGGPNQQPFSKESFSAVADTLNIPVQRGSGEHSFHGQAEFASLCEDVIHTAMSMTSSRGITDLPSNSPHNILHGQSDSLSETGLARQIGLICLHVGTMPPVAFTHATAIRNILLNLLTNSIKNTYEGCISVCLDFISLGSGADVDQVITLRIADTGKGIPQDFIDNRLFVPFSQVNQLDSGVGLGLSIVKRTVDSLGGNIEVDSDEATGTTVTVTLPWSGAQNLSREGVEGPNSSLLSASLSATSEDSPALYAQLCLPAKWLDGERGRRCADLMRYCLDRSLRNTVQTQLDSWRPGTSPDVIIVFADDMTGLSSAYNEQCDRPMLILSTGLGNQCVPQLNLKRTAPEYVVSETLTASKLRRAFETLVPGAFTRRDSNAILSSGLQPLDIESPPGQSDEGSKNESEDEGLLESVDAVSETRREISPIPRTNLPDFGSETPHSYRPKLLLVDDNAVNLRVLEAFVQKCDIESHAAVTGGKEAITAFQSAIENYPTSSFDIIFMDLSMPQVSGFEATSTIRDIETRFFEERHGSEFQRAYIVALTGLVSSKDRVAASDAGMDEYMTKPAALKDIRHVVKTWIDAKRLRKPQLHSELPNSHRRGE